MRDRESPGGIAAHDWFVRARVRIREEHHANSLEWVLRVFRAGEELAMMQWGWAGQEIDTDAWWTTNQYIPGAHVVPANKVEVMEILEERQPESDV
ncbi:hypothetical protein ABT052_43420 [Streptomyces sp. NPDC002766]|uniref:hypothetical protein n=1 Tax=unclassified Streptomyces TaxID=2593676 RepID=UPI00331666CC